MAKALRGARALLPGAVPVSRVPPPRSNPQEEKTPDNLERTQKTPARQKEVKGSPAEKEHARPDRHLVTDFRVFIPLSRGLSHGPRRGGSARGGGACEAAPPAPLPAPARPHVTPVAILDRQLTPEIRGEGPLCLQKHGRKAGAASRPLSVGTSSL